MPEVNIIFRYFVINVMIISGKLQVIIYKALDVNNVLRKEEVKEIIMINNK